MDSHQQDLVAQGLARWYRGRLIPIMKGGDGTDDAPDTEPLFAPVPEDLSTLDDAALAALVTSYDAAIREVGADPSQFVSAEYTTADLLAETTAALATLRSLKAEQASRTAPIEVSEAELAEFEALAAEAAVPAETAEVDDTPPGDDPPPADDPAPEVAPEPEPAEVVAAATPRPALRRMPPPSPSREIATTPANGRLVSLTAAAGAPNRTPGDVFGSEVEVAEAMIDRHRRFGSSGPGTVEKFTIALADWKGEYPADRRLMKDEETNYGIIDAATKPGPIMSAFNARVRAQLNGAPDDLVASGGLCAPVTPYYNLQYLSVPVRPVMSALPSFNADRGGLRYARPAGLGSITTATGLITEAEDEAGGSSATKSCQVIDCPPFQETDVDIIYHCLQFGNLGARAFPELVAQWNNLVLAAQARLAESALLTSIDAFSTQVTAGALGLGASATLFSQILTAANGIRSRNRMNPEAVLRLMLPWWAVDLIISDVIRTQFQRFETDRAKVIALLRSFNIEPTFYIDGANGRGQVYGAQADGALLPFPPEVVWYLFPEGSFLYLDGGTLELGIVRDSVLNAQNDFQIFGETFENVAFVGVEALAVVTTTCDSGVVVAPADSTGCPISYGS